MKSAESVLGDVIFGNGTLLGFWMERLGRTARSRQRAVTSLPYQEIAPCPLCERTELVERLKWPQAPEILYYQCAACGHVWSPGQDTLLVRS